MRRQVEMLGGLRVIGGDRVIDRFRTRQTGLLLAYLAYYSDRPHPREALVELLWPGVEPHAGRNRLSKALSWLRDVLEPSASPPGAVLKADRLSVSLDPEAVSTDVAAFRTLLRSAKRTEEPEERVRRLAAAVDRYRGELLPGYHEEWVLTQRAWLEERFFRALDSLIAHLEKAGERERALAYARRSVTVDPLREESHRDLIRLLAAVGRPNEGLRSYVELERLLREALGTTPMAETRALVREIERAIADKGPTTNDRHVEEFSHNLPLQLTSFVGRGDQIAETQQMLAAHRLVTLTGAGGCGKTRLALQVAADVLGEYPDGVWIIELAPLAEGALAAQRVATVLGVREEPGRSLIETLVGYLKPRQLLLVLDNCEHMVEWCARLAETLLQACPRLRVMATSRETLGIAGEAPYRVPSLLLPEAVQLFLDRARLIQPRFAMTNQNAVAVAEVCRRLDGIPLAIELVVTRLKALPVEELASRLDDMFRLLNGGSRTALPRQQTLRALIDWSYDLLSGPEQAMLRQLSVFAGGWTLEAAEGVRMRGGS